jgi:hypothetical protein
MIRLRALPVVTGQMVESLQARQLLCGGHFNWDNFETTFPTEAAILKGELPPAHTDAGPEGGANIVWTNRGLASDNFASTFGANAGAARGVVDAVIRHYERVINDFNQPGGGNTINVTISMDSSGTGLGGGAGSYVVSNGYMTGGAITIDRGNNGSGSGWYLDPQPDDFAEFNGQITNAFAVDAGAGSAAAGLSDFYTIIMAEMTHVLGVNSNTSTVFNAAGTREWTDTSQADTAEGGGIGTFHVFQGDLINHLMTSNNGGSGGSDRNVPLHGAGSGVNVNFAAQTWTGAQDAMNAVYEGSRRYLVPETSRLIMADAYGYATTSAQNFGTGYANLNLTNGLLTVRGGDFHPGSPVSNDNIAITVSGSQLYVVVNPPVDIAGTWTQPGGGDFPAWTSIFNVADVNSININGEDGNDSIYVYGVPSGVGVTVNAGTGNDLIQVGDGDVDDVNSGVQGNVTVNGGTGTDTMLYFDFFDDIGNDIYNVTNSAITKSLTGSVTYNNADIESLELAGNPQANTFNVNSTDGTVAYLFSGFGGNDSFRIGNDDFDNNIRGNITLSGGAGTDTVFIDDTADTLNDDYLVSGNAFSKNGNSADRAIASSTTEVMQVNGSNNANSYNVPQVSNWLDVIIQAGSAADTFTAGFNNLDANISTSVLFDGNGGTDAITVTDGAGAGTTYNFDNNSLDKGGTGVIGYVDSESFDLTLNALNDTFNIFSTHSQTPLALNTGSGDDTVNVGLAGTFLFNFGSDLSINSSSGDDLLNVADPDYAGLGTYTVVNGRVDLPFNGASVNHSGFETLLVEGSQGNNTFNINQTNITTLVTGGDGDDTINVGNGNFEANITATVLAAGGDGIDIANYLDASDTGNDTYTITSGGVAKNSTAIVLSTSFFGPTIDNVAIFAGAASHTFNVNSLGSASVDMNLIVNAGNGNDTMNVTPVARDISGLNGNVTLSGDGGTDSIVMDDFLAAGGDTTVLSGGLTKSDWTNEINYGAATTNENILLSASNAASVIQMIGSPLTAAFRIDANGGADDIDIQGNALGTAVTVTTGAGLDTLRLNDDASGVVRVDLIQSEDLSSLIIDTGGLLTVVAGGNKTLDITGATLNGRIDLNDNYLIRRSNVNNAFYDTRLRTGYNAGAWTTTTQAAIFSSVAAAATSAKDALGMAQADQVGRTTFGGVAVGGTDLLIGYTQYGDTDLDRDVDFDDLLRLAQNYGQTAKFWYQGTFDYDATGSVNFDDLLRLAQNYGTTLLRSANQSVLASREDDLLLA